MTHGKIGKITGTENGPFIIHENITRIEIDFDDFATWSVTHTKTGMRFPWSFTTEEAATAFCDDVLPVMPWDEVDARISGSQEIAEWGMNEPTKEQKDAVRLCAVKRGGIRAHIRTTLAER